MLKPALDSIRTPKVLTVRTLLFGEELRRITSNTTLRLILLKLGTFQVRQDIPEKISFSTRQQNSKVDRLMPGDRLHQVRAQCYVN